MNIEKNEKRIVPVPSNSNINYPGSVQSVCLFSNEDVQWIWTHTDDGVSYVSGYEIIQK